MGKKVGRLVKNKVLLDIAKDDLSKKDIAKKNNISLPTLYKIYNTNREQYNQLLDDLKNRINARCLYTAQKAVKSIDKGKLQASSGLQLSQISKNLVEITKSEQSQINIQVNVPQNKDDLVNFVLNTKTIDIPVNNESANFESENGVIEAETISSDENNTD